MGAFLGDMPIAAQASIAVDIHRKLVSMGRMEETRDIEMNY